jgi:chromosome segregation ATPase
MRRAFFLTLLVFGMLAGALGQAASSDSQTLQALLSEVRELRHDLRASLARIQSAQILLSRLQTQQAVVTHASERLDGARSKLAGAQDHQKHVAADIKRLESTLSSEENLTLQKALQDEMNRFKSELESATDMEQQSQATEVEDEQQLRAEQDKLSVLETQLDELVRKPGSSGGQPSQAAP